MSQKLFYAFRVHNRETENDPQLATVMYSIAGPQGPWHDMATGHPDYIEDILDALLIFQDSNGYDQFENPMQPSNKFDITLESQGDAKLTSNLVQLVERLRDVNPYSPAQVIELAAEAVDLLEARRG